MSQRVYTTENVAKMTNAGVSSIRSLVLWKKAPKAAYQVVSNTGRIQYLWDQAGLEEWHRLITEREELRAGRVPRKRRAASESPFGVKQGKAFSDHNAVNQVGKVMITWRLWWQDDPQWPDSTIWWFSTPEGWFTSKNDGRSWEKHGDGVTDDGMRRPSGPVYHAVNDPRKVRGPRNGIAAHNGAMHMQRVMQARTKLRDGDYVYQS